MKQFLKWTGLLVGFSAAGIFAYQTIQAGRRRLKTALEHAEAIADKSRATLEETQAALHDARASM